MTKAPSTTKSLSEPDMKSLSGRADPVETAKFVADFTLELSSLARASRLDLLAYLLDMARLEAIRVVQASHPET
jgi:hypothetical protein